MTIVNVTDTAFLTMTYCQVTYVFLCFLSFYRSKKKKEQKNKKKRRINTQKNCIDPESNQKRTRNLSITSLAFYHCTDAYVKKLLPKESS